MATTCLLIDDDPDVHYLFAAALHDVDPAMDITSEEDSRQAMENLLRDTAAIPDFIFLDLNMPRLDGRQCLVKLKAMVHLRDVPVVIFSTSANQEDVSNTRRLGSAGYIVKPSTYTQLVDTLKKALEWSKMKMYFYIPE